MALKSKSYFPPGAWVFYEALTGWSSPSYLGFDDTVRALIAHRAANRGRFAPEKMDFAQVSVEVEQQVEARLRQTYGAKADQWLEGAPSAAPPNFPWNPLRAPLRVPAAAGANKVMSGVGTILQWLGGGLRPTDQATADKRALICSTCQLNVSSAGLEKAIQTVGDILHSIASAKAQLKLQTPYDAKLKSCSACGCVVATKVWVPSEHIKKGMTKEVQEALAPQCWIRPLLT